MTTLIDCIRSADWRAIVTYASGILVVVNVIYLIYASLYEAADDSWSDRAVRRARKMAGSIPQLQKVPEIQSDIESMKADLEDIRCSLRSYPVSTPDIEGCFKMSSAEIDRKIESMEQEYSRHMDDVRNLEDRLKEASIKSEFYDRDLGRAFRRLENLRKKLDDVSFYEDVMDDLSKQADGLKKSMERMKDEISNTKAFADVLEKKIQDGDAKEEYFNRVVTSVSDKYIAIHKQMQDISSCEKKIQGFSSRVDKFEKKLEGCDKMVEQYDQARKKVDTLCAFYDLMDRDGYWSSIEQGGTGDEGQQV